MYQTMPIAYGLQLLYKKRWIARWLQECGIRVWVDLNVAPKFRELNKLGVPKGYNAFATRGHEGELCHLEAELQIAREISGVETPNMIVYGGGETCKSYCRQNWLIYIAPTKWTIAIAVRRRSTMAKDAGSTRASKWEVDIYAVDGVRHEYGDLSVERQKVILCYI